MSNQAPLSVKQAAARLDLHPRKIIRLIESHDISAYKAFDGLRAPWLIPATEVERYDRQRSAA